MLSREGGIPSCAWLQGWQHVAGVHLWAAWVTLWRLNADVNKGWICVFSSLKEARERNISISKAVVKKACCSLKNKHVKRHFGATGETEGWSPALLLQGLSLPQECWGLKSAAFWGEDVVLTVCHKKWLLYKTTSSFPLWSKIFNSSCSCSNWKSCSDSLFFFF